MMSSKRILQQIITKKELIDEAIMLLSELKRLDNRNENFFCFILRKNENSDIGKYIVLRD